MTTTPQAALLTDDEVAQCINLARTNLFDRAGTTSFRIARSIEQAILAKLQATQEPGQAVVNLSKDALECLQDVVSHYNDFTKACDTMIKLCIDNSEDDSALYWKHQLDVLDRMKNQAASAIDERNQE